MPIVPLQAADVPELVALARDIWYRHYPGIITVEQIEYMLDQRYRAEVILQQLESGDVWWDTLVEGGRIVAFAACEPGTKPASVKLDKLYVHPDRQRRGRGSSLLGHIEARARREGRRLVYLQVNKHNVNAIAAYARNGYAVTEAIVTDIGGGFVMDDYVMAKELAGG
ncbi:MAG TPA: GNAT family N-acetyltransferase [Pelomicrobium sp.]|nr:GNAT family N-acetyltransferase [Pelomicrobium sp.]